ncbi:MAG: DNA primase, partial [Bacteroidia bacterium]|nr:DNA primase [Bacteroidia bacterium]
MITRQSVDQVLSTAVIEEVVGDFVTLKKRGVNMIGNCPFHDEKTPSFIVSPTKGIFKCFGCGKAGNSVEFIKEHEELNFPDAIRYLAQKYSIVLEEDNTISRDEMDEAAKQRESILIVLEYAKTYFRELLEDDSDGKIIGKGYFKERGFTEQTIKTFELGYARKSWDAFATDAMSKGYNPAYMEAAGLIKKRDGQESWFDMFRDRVIFPIHGINGKVIAFAGRQLQKDDKGPKYLNSPETEVYHKSDILYGMYFAKKEMKKQNNCYLVEGYTDVITLFQGGVENVVASSGTSLTDGQIKLIRRFSENVTVLYDGDYAGLKASLRGTDMLLERGL